ncbi:MAG TPA: hypothetical protein DCG75_16080 [Bacteroidales bacterium]|nr:hypothetical protein [Bacteroidales bacterium]
MKKLLIVFSALALITLVSATLPGDIDKSIAKVNQSQGFYLFADCDPVAEYEYLGTVKNKVGMSELGVGNDDYETVKGRLIKKAKKEFPDGDGIIFDFSKDKGQADVIKFK